MSSDIVHEYPESEEKKTNPSCPTVTTRTPSLVVTPLSCMTALELLIEVSNEFEFEVGLVSLTLNLSVDASECHEENKLVSVLLPLVEE